MVKEYENFITDEECQFMIEAAQKQFMRTTTLGKEIEGYRVADGAWLNDSSEIVKNYRKKVSEISGFPTENMELIHIVKYEVGGEYKSHHDFFHPGEGYYDNEMKRGGQRSKTALVYLNEDFTGGETEFPKVNIRIQPQKRKLVLWDNAFEDESPDYDSLHAGLPVISGTKYIAVIWIRFGKFV